MTIRFCALAAFVLAAVVALLGVFDPVMAAMGQSLPGQIGLQEAATPIARELHAFYDFTNIVIIAIAIFV